MTEPRLRIPPGVKIKWIVQLVAGRLSLARAASAYARSLKWMCSISEPLRGDLQLVYYCVLFRGLLGLKRILLRVRSELSADHRCILTLESV